MAFCTLAVAAATLVLCSPWLLRPELPDDEPLDDEPPGPDPVVWDARLLDELGWDAFGWLDALGWVGVALGRDEGGLVGCVEVSSLAAVLRAWTAMASDSCSSTMPCWACWALSSAVVQAPRS